MKYTIIKHKNLHNSKKSTTKNSHQTMVDCYGDEDWNEADWDAYGAEEMDWTPSQPIA